MNAEMMTERFEMRLPASVLEKVDAWRARQYDFPSRSEGVRRLLETGLGASGEGRPLKLSDGEKLTLTMLCELFKGMKLKSEINPEFIESAIQGGHYWGLKWEYSHIFHNHEDSETALTEVVDVLDMWSFLEGGFGKLSKKERDRVAVEADPFGKNVIFCGFDGNYEGEYCSIADFLIDRLHRFSGFKDRDLNSHMPTIDTYRRMLSVFKPIRNSLSGRDLNVAEIIEVLRAKLHPSRRQQMNSGTQRIKSLLGSARGIVADDITEVYGTDQRLYVQVVGVPGFPVFAIKPTGVYELPFEHSYSKASMKKMGLAILNSESDGLNAVLFADVLAARPGNRHDLCAGYDPEAIERVRQMAEEAVPEKSSLIWRGPGERKSRP